MGRSANASAAETAPARHEPDWEPPIPGRRRVLKTWDEYMALAKRIIERFDHQFDLRHFDYHHPVRLQKCAARFRKPYPVKVAYTDWGDACQPDGGVLRRRGQHRDALQLPRRATCEPHFRVVCMDWVGRGRSGWMADERDYSLADLRRAAAPADRASRRGPGDPAGLVDGRQRGDRAGRAPPEAGEPADPERHRPLHPARRAASAARRRSRATTCSAIPRTCCARSAPRRRTTGPISDDIRFNVTFHQTRWSDEEGGRVYRHDVRALQAYRDDAQDSLDQWKRVGRCAARCC